MCAAMARSHYRAFGTAAEHAVVPASQVAPLPDVSPLSRAHASAFLPSRRIAVFIRRVRSKDGPCWCRVVLGLSPLHAALVFVSSSHVNCARQFDARPPDSQDVACCGDIHRRVAPD